MYVFTFKNPEFINNFTIICYEFFTFMDEIIFVNLILKVYIEYL